MAKIGVTGARAVKIGKGLAFFETTASGKCRRITVYPQAQKESRLLLREIGVSDAGQSGFDNSKAVADCRTLMEEEEKIFFTPNKAELAKAAAAARKRQADAGEESTSIAVNTVQAEEPEPEVTEEPIAQEQETTEEKPVATTKKKKKKVREKSFLEKLGLGDMTESQLMTYGAVVLVLLIIIVVVVRSKMNSDIQKNREKSIRQGTATSIDQLGAPRRKPQARHRK